jgi:hypothetical protein
MDHETLPINPDAIAAGAWRGLALRGVLFKIDDFVEDLLTYGRAGIVVRFAL